VKAWEIGVCLAVLAGCGAGQATAPAAAPLGSASAAASAPKPAPGAALCSATSKSAPKGPDVVARVEVRGQARLGVAALCDAITTKAGDAADVETVQADLRRLWATGEVEDVFVSSDDSPLGRVLTYEVRERPVVKAWHMDGFKAVDATRVRERFGPAGQPFSAAAVSDTVARIRADYLAQGYRSAAVQHRVEKAGAQQVEVYVTVTEGPIATIKSIQVQGASKTRAAELLALVETGAGTFNTVGKLYRPDSLEADRLKMTGWYYDRGMVTATVQPEKAALSADQSAIDIVIGVTEGPVYRIGKVAFEGKLAVPETKYLELFGARKGQVFSRAELLKGMERIQEFEKQADRHGKITPKTEVDAKKQTLDLVIVIER
jgi:outer membrane protein insertion porin family